MGLLTSVAGRFQKTEALVLSDGTGWQQLLQADPTRYAVGFALPHTTDTIIYTVKGDANSGIPLFPAQGLVWYDVPKYANLPMSEWWWNSSTLGEPITVYTIIDTEG